MTKNKLFTTSILVAATAAAGFFGCSSNTGGDSSVGSGSSSGGLVTGSSGGSGNPASNGSGSSSGAGQTGVPAACMAPSSVPSGSLPAYVAVVPMMNACSSTQITGFVSSCVATGADADGCVSWANSNPTCAGCIVQGTDAGETQTGAVLFNAAGRPAGSNVPGCIALEDSTNGPACAAQLEPLMQCVAYACESCPDQTSFTDCDNAVSGNGGLCGDLASSAQMPCANDLGQNGVAATKCGYGSPSELTAVINVICGSGP